MRDEEGQTVVEYALMLVLGLTLITALAAALGFFPQFVVDAVEDLL